MAEEEESQTTQLAAPLLDEEDADAMDTVLESVGYVKRALLLVLLLVLRVRPVLPLLRLLMWILMIKYQC